jgi:hypothetical protein
VIAYSINCEVSIATARDDFEGPRRQDHVGGRAGSWNHFRTELEEEVKRRGGDPEEKTTLTGDIYLGSVNFTPEMFASRAQGEAVTEMIRGEGHALKALDDALKRLDTLGLTRGKDSVYRVVMKQRLACWEHSKSMDIPY